MRPIFMFKGALWFSGDEIDRAEQGLQMGRWVVVRSGLPLSVPGVSVNRYCGSGVETIAMAVGKIQAGFAHNTARSKLQFSPHHWALSRVDACSI